MKKRTTHRQENKQEHQQVSKWVNHVRQHSSPAHFEDLHNEQSERPDSDSIS